MNPVLQSPDLTLSADSNAVLNYRRDARNYITQLFGEQLPAIRNGFFNVGPPIGCEAQQAMAAGAAAGTGASELRAQK